MIKKISLLALVILFAGMLSSCGKKADPNTFIVGFDASFPPYGFLAEDGKYIGFDLDLAAEVAKRNNWPIELKPIDWAAKDAELNAGTISCIWNGFTITEERKKQYTWSEPYVQNKQLVLVKNGSPIKTLADLNGKNVVAQDGSSGASALEDFAKEQQKTNPNFKFANYDKVPDYTSAYTMVETGAAEAVALDSAVANGFVDKSKGRFVVLGETLIEEYYGIGFKMGNTELRDKVQATLKAMVADGTCQKIVDKWKADKKNGGDGIDFVLK